MIADKTYEKKGAKNVIINTCGNDKNHVTVILPITSGGNNLPPILIFKGKQNKNNEKSYNKLDVVKNKNI